MIKLELDKPIPYICELKRGCSDKDLEDAISLLKIDPTCDDDLRLWFAIQAGLISISLEGYGTNHNGPASNKRTYQELLSRSTGVILDKYWVDRRDWDLNSLVGGFKKLNHTDGDVGLEVLKKNWVPKTDSIVLRSCSSKKPYDASPTVKQVTKLLSPYKCELAVASYTPTPMEAAKQYPFAFYQGTMWDAVEPPGNWMPYNVKEFFDYFDYKNILVWTKPKQLPTMREGLKDKPQSVFFESKNPQNLPKGILSAYYYSVTKDEFIQEIAERNLEKNDSKSSLDLF